MRDSLDRSIDETLADVVNSPERPSAALIERVHTAAEAKARARHSALLIAAGAGLTLNAVLVLLLTYFVAVCTGGGWAGAAAVLIGLTLAMLPAVPLLALGELPSYMQKRRNLELER